MSASSAIRTSRVPRSRRAAAPGLTETRFDRRLSDLLSQATNVICEKGYEGASMRDLSRATGMSLAGLYHYFGSKERLLYLIQKHAFTIIIEQLKARLQEVADPAQRIRIFIQNHLEYFVTNQSGLKVLAHEDEALKNGFNAELAAIKRQYYRICVGLMDDLKRERRIEFNSRTAVMSLFGMINWIYTWYNPRVDGTAEDLAQQMSDIILSGIGHNNNPLASGAVRRRSRGRARDLPFAPVAKSTLKGRVTKRAVGAKV
ncbi:MAG: TetR/AcrR family transcriptional regulator [Terriglobales bacterium]|jgi:AcrR family transcriptional regulator